MSIEPGDELLDIVAELLSRSEHDVAVVELLSHPKGVWQPLRNVVQLSSPLSVRVENLLRAHFKTPARN